MFRNYSVIATICARGGSKGIPQKNIKPLLGVPLITHTINQALALDWIDRIVVSTDSEQIKQVAEQSGINVPFLRPSELAQDLSPKVPSIQHAVIQAEQYWHETYDLVLDLDPTNPLRIKDDIEGTVNALLADPTAISSFSVANAYRNPYMNMIEVNEGYAQVVKPPKKPIMRRQDAPLVYDVVASIYAIRRKYLGDISFFPTPKTKIYIMPEERAIDIDSQIDFEIVELLLKNRKL